MQIVLDAKTGLSIEQGQHANELTTLAMLKEGLLLLANNIRQREFRFVELAKEFKFSRFGGETPEERTDLNRIACMFHWFGVSVCNYARLVGFIRGLEQGQFTRSELQSSASFAKIKKAVDDYVAGISELESVLIWRNKVAGHFAITDPRKDDNIATLNLSVMFPVTLESGIYFVGGMALTHTNPNGTFTSEIPTWSVTQVFESLIPRFWPDISAQTSDPLEDSRSG